MHTVPGGPQTNGPGGASTAGTLLLLLPLSQCLCCRAHQHHQQLLRRKQSCTANIVACRCGWHPLLLTQGSLTAASLPRPAVKQAQAGKGAAIMHHMFDDWASQRPETMPGHHAETYFKKDASCLTCITLSQQCNGALMPPATNMTFTACFYPVCQWCRCSLWH